MRRRIVLTILFFSFCSPLKGALAEGSAVSYELSGGRFGDNLLAFAHGMWISYILKTPLIYTPFPYSERLALHKNPSLLPSCSANSRLRLEKEGDFLHLWSLYRQDHKTPIKILVPFYSETAQEFEQKNTFLLWTQLNWDDAAFIEILRASIEPITPIVLPDVPKDRLTVALHIRTGNRDEPSWARFSWVWPMKGPPPSYYIHALRLLFSKTNMPLYVHLFTDHSNPSALAAYFAAECSDLDILFSCRRSENSPETHVLEDFFAMKQFSCLIRSDSNYSLIASKLFPYEIVISPLHYRREPPNKITIDKILLQIRSGNDFPQPIKVAIPIY